MEFGVRKDQLQHALTRSSRLEAGCAFQFGLHAAGLSHPTPEISSPPYKKCVVKERDKVEVGIFACSPAHALSLD